MPSDPGCVEIKRIPARLQAAKLIVEDIVSAVTAGIVRPLRECGLGIVDLVGVGKQLRQQGGLMVIGPERGSS